MDFTASSASLLNIKADSLILATGPQLQNSAKADLDKSLDGAISSLIKAGDFSWQVGTDPSYAYSWMPRASALFCSAPRAHPPRKNRSK